jgi:hypothetical protein
MSSQACSASCLSACLNVMKEGRGFGKLRLTRAKPPKITMSLATMAHSAPTRTHAPVSVMKTETREPARTTAASNAIRNPQTDIFQYGQLRSADSLSTPHIVRG